MPKMTIYKTITFLLVVFLFSACTEGNNKPDANKKEATKSTTAKVVGEQLPSITMDIMKNIFEKSDYADFVFYNTNFSMSMDQKPSIQSTLRHIAETVPNLNPNCKAIGRVFYQIEGENYMEADIFFEEDCKYFVFYVDNKKTYANEMTQDGFNHYTNIFSQLGSPQGQ